MSLFYEGLQLSKERDNLTISHKTGFLFISHMVEQVYVFAVIYLARHMHELRAIMTPIRPYRHFQLESPRGEFGGGFEAKIRTGCVRLCLPGTDVLIYFHRRTATIEQLSFNTTTMRRKQSLLVLCYSM